MANIKMKAVVPLLDNEHTLESIQYTVKVSDNIILFDKTTTSLVQSFDNDFNINAIVMVQLIYNIKNTSTGVIKKQYSDIDVVTLESISNRVVVQQPKIDVEVLAYILKVSVSEPIFKRGISVLRSVDVIIEDINDVIIDKRLGVYNLNNIEFVKPDESVITVKVKYNFDIPASSPESLLTVLLNPDGNDEIMINKKFIKQSGDLIRVSGLSNAVDYKLILQNGETAQSGVISSEMEINTPSTTEPVYLFIENKVFKLNVRRV